MALYVRKWLNFDKLVTYPWPRRTPLQNGAAFTCTYRTPTPTAVVLCTHCPWSDSPVTTSDVKFEPMRPARGPK